MDTENPLKDFSENNDITIQKILNNLLDGKKNLELKTHIAKPKKLASLLSLAKYLKKFGYIETYKTIVGFIRTFLEYMVSYKRLSRIETITALTPLNTKEMLKEKFTTSLE